MNTALKTCVLCLAVAALTLQYSRAQPLSGAVSVPFSATNSAVYDLTGSYQLDQQLLGAAGASNDLTFGISLANDLHGNLTGVGLTEVDLGNGASTFGASYTAKGRVSGGGTRPTRVILNVHLMGEDTVFGSPNVRFKISAQYNLIVDPGTLTLQGTSRGEANFSNIGGGRIRSVIAPAALPTGVDGTWTAQLDLVALNRVGGSAMIVFPNNRTLQMGLTGSFSERTGLTKVRLSGINGYQGNTLTLSLDSSGSVQTANGIILGQTVRQ